jgi:putative membrane protein
MAVMAQAWRALRRSLGVLVAVSFLCGAATAQTAEAVRPLDAETFVRLAHSSAILQTRAAELAAGRNTRSEARTYAQRMLEFRRGQVAALERAASENGLRINAVKQFEHQVLIDNLEPLDFLALSRRYAELQVQALQQELQIYAGGERCPAAWVKVFANENLPILQRLLAEAEAVRQAVGP